MSLLPVSDTIIYEQPLNERIRTFLRLEFLFNRVGIALNGSSELANQDAITGLLNILSIFDRSELKSEFIKELERLTSNLVALENSPGVDKKALDDLLAELDQSLDALHMNKSPLGQSLKENNFLHSIRQRSSISGGTCAFDIPAYHYWLRHTADEEKKKQLNEWLQEFSSARTAIEITLRLIRGGTGFIQRRADAGFYQRSLDSGQPNQLIRVKIAKSAEFYPEISGGKHRFTVRFMMFDLNKRPIQATEDIPFALSCCSM